jgi:transcriptional regulator with XRE-family HTH domain
MPDFAQTLRTWRQTRRLSQLALSGEAGVSARHLAFLETGRARPSRGMVLRLAEALAMPRGARNGLLTAAGFAEHFPAHPLDAAEMDRVRRAMDWTIQRHDPWPALVMDRLWRIVALNRVAARLFAPMRIGPGASLLETLAARPGPADFIENWPEVGHHTLLRLRAESARAGGNPALDRAAAALAADPAVAAWTPDRPPGAVIPTVYRAGSLRLALFSTYAQFGSAEEVALEDMKIELMFPADAAAEAALTALAGD